MTETPRLLGGRYEVGELIGRGGMADVHLGHDTRLGRTVAIKVLRSDLARDHTFLARFRREAQAAGGLNHHAIVAVYDSGEDESVDAGGAPLDIPYIVMEYVDGETLRDMLNAEGPFPPDEAARVTMGILSALEYSHQRGIVHRDIKPANVMITRGGGVKVMDFGIARALDDHGATMTSAQAVVGTARYLSPEQARGDQVDERSDLYSTGCVFFELLCGRTPFVGEPVSLVYQHISDQPAPPSTYGPSVPQPMDAVALHALEKHRQARYQTAGQFRADLQRARTGEKVSPGALASLAAADAAVADATRNGPVAPSPTPPRGLEHTREIDGSRSPRGRTALWVLAGVAALIAILGIGYLVMNRDSGPKMAAVPWVKTMQQSAAESVLTNNHFVPKAQKVTSDQPVGIVVDQDPEPGLSAKVGATVTIKVSAGPGTVAVPDVRGKSVTDAEKTLRDAGFTNYSVSQTKVDNTQYSANQVASTSPSNGAPALPTQQIVLTLSSGQVRVPDVLGKDSGAAQNEISKAFLTPEVRYRTVGDPSQYNKVVSEPNANKMLAVNSSVVIYVGQPAPGTVTITQRPPSTSSSSPTSSSPSSSSTPPPSSSESTPPPVTASPPTPSTP